MAINTTITEAWRDGFVLAAEATEAVERAKLYRAVQAGSLVPVARGAYLPRPSLAAMNADERYLAKVRALALTRPTVVFSHYSAAALWQLPMVGSWPRLPHVVAARSPGGRSKKAFVRHCVGIPEDSIAIDGLSTTPLARTLVDIGLVAPFATAVAMMDFAMRPLDPRDTGPLRPRVDRERLLAELAMRGQVPGVARCRRAIEFADGRSGSPGESLSRANIHVLGFPAPILQQRFDDARGLIGFTDFWWSGCALIGEFDGFGKYVREELANGRSSGEVVHLEKIREDRLRALGPSVTRWGWDIALSLPRLRAHLVEAGLR